MPRMLYIAARIAATPIHAAEEAPPVDYKAIDKIVAELKRELDLLGASGRRDNLPRLIQRLNKMLIGLEAIIKIVTAEHEEVEKSTDQLVNKLEKAQILTRPLRLQIR